MDCFPPSHPHASSQCKHASGGAQPSASATHGHFQQLSLPQDTFLHPPNPPAVKLLPAASPSSPCTRWSQAGALKEPAAPLLGQGAFWARTSQQYLQHPCRFSAWLLCKKKWEVSTALARTGIMELLALATAFCIPVFPCCVCFVKA